MALPKVDPLLDTLVGNFRITRKLGSGSMGTVYLAEHREVGKRIAVKVLAGHLTEDSSMVGRFMLEAKAIGRLQHPGIIEMFDFGELEDGRSYYTMEYLEGETLSMRMHRGHLSLAEIQSILDQVCDALTIVHAKGIIHRDLKPGNIFLALKGNRRVVKILDFGIAKMQSSARLGNDPLTSTGSVLGTPVYMSPEQAMGENATLSGLSDIYSLGVILYKIFTAQYPIYGTAIHEVVAYHFMHEAIPLRDFNPGVPEPLAAVVMKSLSKDPSKRQKSPKELYFEFQGACVGLPTDLSFENTAIGTPVNSASFVGQQEARPDSDLWNVEISVEGDPPPPPPPPPPEAPGGFRSLSPMRFLSRFGSGTWQRKVYRHPRLAYGAISFLLFLIGLAIVLIVLQKQVGTGNAQLALETVLPRRILVLPSAEKKSENLTNRYHVRTTPSVVTVRIRTSSGSERTQQTPMEVTLAESESCELAFSHDGYRDSTITLRFDAAIVERDIHQELVPLAVAEPPAVPPSGMPAPKPPSPKGKKHERRTLGDGVL